MLISRGGRLSAAAVIAAKPELSIRTVSEYHRTHSRRENAYLTVDYWTETRCQRREISLRCHICILRLWRRDSSLHQEAMTLIMFEYHLT